jgi:hypothetical protein
MRSKAKLGLGWRGRAVCQVLLLIYIRSQREEEEANLPVLSEMVRVED